MLQQINDLDTVAAGKMLVAQAFQVRKGGDRTGSLPRDVKTKIPLFGIFRARGLARNLGERIRGSRICRLSFRHGRSRFLGPPRGDASLARLRWSRRLPSD